MMRGSATLPQTQFREILDELIVTQAHEARLLQFKHRISARQYLRLYRLMARYVKSGSSVLDWGAGNGHFSYFLIRAGYRASGLRSMLDYLYKKEGDPARITWLLQSHPPLVKRIGRLDTYIPTLTGKPLAES